MLVGAAGLVLAGPTGAAADWALSLEGGYLDVTNARDSARAVFGDVPGGFAGGASVRYDLGPRFFVTAGGRFFQRTGERVFAADANSPVFRLGHPLKVRMVPAYALLGFRPMPRRARWSLVPYLGLGPGVTFYHEESRVGGLREGVVDEAKASGHAVGGLEYGRGGLRVGLELTYSMVPDSAGMSGISKVYGESDVGGFAVVGKITLAR